MTAYLLTLVVQVSLLVVAALIALAALRRSSAALRHALLAAALFGALGLPVFNSIVPRWDVQLAPQWTAAEPARLPGMVAARELGAVRTPGASAVAPTTDPEPGPLGLPLATARVLTAVWAAGAGLGLAVLAAGLARLTWLARQARPLTHPLWVRLMEEAAAEAGVRRPVALLHSAHPSILVAWGWFRPRIMVPAPALAWAPADISVVLRHETAHIARGDWMVQVLAESLRAVNWFNPLLWIASARLRAESECACDDAVLRRGVGGAEYAERLLALARVLSAPDRWAPVYPAPSMARRSSLERRVRSMLNARVNRSPLTARSRAAVTALAFAAALPIAGIALVAQSASFKGSVVDPTSRVVADARVVVTNVQTKATHEVRTDAAGTFTFAGLPTGRYSMEVRRPGFMTIKAEVVLAEEGGQGRYALQLGSLQETVVVSVAAAAGGAPAGAARPSVPASAARVAPSAASPCSDPGTTGGHIVPPRKLRDVKPVYPEQLRAGRVAGEVKVEGVVGADGAVHNLKVLEAPHADLGQAVVDAVSRWAFSATLLNCQPVDVKITVIARFEY